jgi:hypothetical protein
VLDNNHGLLPRTRDDLEGPELDIALDRSISEPPADETLGICMRTILSETAQKKIDHT